jgi:LmbE family N-acetylglucosaminyl deacetylase
VLADGRPGLELLFWRLPDRAVADEPTLVPRLQHLLRSAAPDVVLVPSPFEIHPDHRAVCLAGLHALRGVERTELLFYEIGQALMPDVLVDITPQLARKRAALRCFASQMVGQAYDEQLLGLNRFRAYTLGPAVTHAEGFQRVPAQAIQGGLPAVLRDVESRLRARFGG